MSSKHFTALMIRLSLGFIHLSAGWAKLAVDYLGHIIGPPDLSMLTDSNIFLIFLYAIAILQIIVGALILSQRYSFIGLLLLIPIQIGILIFTIVFGFGATSIINVILLILNFYALIVERESIQKLKRLDFSVIKTSNITSLYPKSILTQLSFVLIGTLVLRCGFFLCYSMLFISYL